MDQEVKDASPPNWLDYPCYVKVWHVSNCGERGGDKFRAWYSPDYWVEDHNYGQGIRFLDNYKVFNYHSAMIIEHPELRNINFHVDRIKNWPKEQWKYLILTRVGIARSKGLTYTLCEPTKIETPWPRRTWDVEYRWIERVYK